MKAAAAPTSELAAATWRNGWYSAAQAVPSPNFGPRPADTAIDLLVLHSISLPPGEYGGPQIEQLFTNTLDFDAHPYFQTIRGLQVSAHFVVRRDGSLLQFVSCDDRAWHAGASSWNGRSQCNDNSIGIELEGLEGTPFDAAQYPALAQLVLAIAQHYPIAQIVGHEHIAPGRKHDPGAGFDWRRLQQLTGWADARFAPQALQPSLGQIS
ncbi:MAG: 1,6-anhydro-N-acetylmuramyl-L-alanine amidase AmpD [Brachymonas sp.]|nr:1,6-anhydro-N-acetylmuramyl-L-alanine amidase AmpD [Brachymonas sp.]